MNFTHLNSTDFPTINKKQILLDWVNTINEPQCLLVTECADLLNGDVYVEILIHFLYLTDNKEMLMNLQKEDINSETPEIKLGIVLNYFYRICNGDNVYQSNIKKLSVMLNDVFKNEELLIEVLDVIRSIFEKNNLLDVDYNETIETNNNQSQDNDNCIGNNNIKSGLNTIQELLEPPNTFTISERNTIVTNKDSETTDKNEFDQIHYKKQQYRELLEKKYNNIFIDSKRNQFEYNENDDYYNSNDIPNEQYLTQQNTYNNNEYAFLPESSTKPILSSGNINYNINNNYSIKPTFQSTSPNSKRIRQHFYKDILTEETPKNAPSYTKMHLRTTSNYINTNSISQTLDIQEDNTYQIHNNKQPSYLKSHKSTINMTRGIMQMNKSMFCIDYPYPRLKYIKFLKPLEPIINCNYNTLHRYKTISLTQTHIPSQIKSNLNKQKKLKQNKIPFPIRDYQYNKEIHTKDLMSYPISIKDKQAFSPSSNNRNNISGDYNFNNFSKNKIDISLIEKGDIRTKIYKWLIYVNLIKKELISIDEVPSFCTNGVLLCDLINRNEGRFATIKGIIRNPISQPQAKANLNKMFNYLNSLEKFNSEYLWNINEIIQGSNNVIWGLLYDLYVYYTKEKAYFVNKLSKSKEKFNKSKHSNIKQSFNKPQPLININEEHFKHQSFSPPSSNTKLNINQLNHITNTNEENDMLMVYLRNQFPLSQNNSNYYSTNNSNRIRHRSARLIKNNNNNIDFSYKVPNKTNNNSKNTIYHRNETNSFNNHSSNKTSISLFSNNYNQQINTPSNNLSYFENEYPRRQRFLLFEKVTSAKLKNKII